MSAVKRFWIPDSPSSSAWPAIALGAVLSVQAAFLLLPGPFWDGWIYDLLFRRGEYGAFMDPFDANGRPLGGRVLWLAMDWFSVTGGPKLLSALSLVGAAMALYATLRLRDRLPSAGAALVCVVTVTVPAIQTSLSSSALQFFLGFFCFFAGLYGFALAAASAGWVRVLAYGLALVLGAASVLLAEAPLSMLPLYPFTWLVVREGWQRLVRPDRAMLGTLLFHGAPVAAGALALVATFTLFPATGNYEEAHSLQLNLLQLVEVAGLFAVALVMCELPLLLAGSWACAGRSLVGFWRSPAVLGALAVLVLGIAPYLAAGRWPAILGWGTRALLLSGLGLGLLAWAVAARAIQGRLPRQQSVVVLVLCVAAVSCTLWRVPLWAARQVKDDAVRAAVAGVQLPPGASTLWVVDPNWVIAAPYRHYEWTALVQLATDRRDLLALGHVAGDPAAAALATASRDLRREHRLLPQAAPLGCQADLHIARLPWHWPVTATLGLLLRAVSPDAYARWLDGRIAVKIEARDDCRAFERQVD